MIESTLVPCWTVTVKKTFSTSCRGLKGYGKDVQAKSGIESYLDALLSCLWMRRELSSLEYSVGHSTQTFGLTPAQPMPSTFKITFCNLFQSPNLCDNIIHYLSSSCKWFQWVRFCVSALLWGLSISIENGIYPSLGLPTIDGEDDESINIRLIFAE